MGKTILANVNGWTPVINSIVKDCGLMSAVVFGRMWRFCQMEDGVCKASLEKISDEIGIDKATVLRHAKDLCKKGYLKDLTPDLRNQPHIYVDTGKASLKIGITVAENNAINESVAESNATVAESNATVAESQLNKDSKKENKKDLVDAILEQEAIYQDKLSRRETWPHREKFPEPIRELLDVFVRCTGIYPAKKDITDWLSAGQDWLDLGITKIDLEKAAQKSKGDERGFGAFTVGRPGGLTSTANSFAGQRRLNGNGHSIDKYQRIVEELTNG